MFLKCLYPLISVGTGIVLKLPTGNLIKMSRITGMRDIPEIVIHYRDSAS